MVNTLDFNALAAHFNQSGRYWYQGDFNYDGVVNASDFDALVANYGQTMSARGMGSLVPEPLVMGAVVPAMLMMRRRTRTAILNEAAAFFHETCRATLGVIFAVGEKKAYTTEPQCPSSRHNLPTLTSLPPIPMKRFSVEEYHQMIQAGVFAHDSRFELLEGWIVPKMSRNPPHDVSLDLTAMKCQHDSQTDWDIRLQSAITTGDSEPEPDLAVVKGIRRGLIRQESRSQGYRAVIEIADSSLLDDRRQENSPLRLAAIKEYWIVNLVTSQVEVYADPTGPSGGHPSYRKHADYKAGESVPLSVGGQDSAPISVTDLLP